MIYIIDGPDGAGKSHLAKKLSKQTGFPIIHRSKPNTPEEKANMMQSYLEGAKSSVNEIWDRSFYSEMVYGPIMRDQAYISIQQMTELERELSKNGALVIHCTDDILKLWNRATQRGETYIKDICVLDEIKEAYGHLFNNIPHIIPVVTYTINEKFVNNENV